MRMLKVLAISFVLIFVFSAVAFSATRLPTWPQSFSIEKGETTAFAVPVTQPGTVTVSLSWQGGPLIVTVKDASGTPLGQPFRLNAPSSTASFEISGSISQRGVLWGISLSSPDPSRRQGQISVTYPPVDNAKFENATRTLLRVPVKPTETQLASMKRPIPASFVQRRAAFLKARADRLAAMTSVATTSTTRMATSNKPATVNMSMSGVRSAVSRVTTHLPVTPAVLPDIRIIDLAQGPQTLTSASPTTGKPGVTVVLTGENLLPADFFHTANANIGKYWTGAMFKIAANVEKPGILSNARQNADGTVSIDAKVPDSSGLIDTYNGTVCLYNASAKTNTVPFKFQPSGLPTITSLTPNTAGPGDMVSLKGYYFSRDDKVFIDIGNGDQELPITYVSDKEVRVYMPDYTSRTPISARIYIAHQYSYGWNGGAPCWFNLIATEITINSVSYVSGSGMTSTNPQGQPGDPIVISGTGFVNPVVHFILGNGINKIAKIDFSDGTTIRTSVPDVTGIAGDYAGSVYVECAPKKTNLVNFTFHPTLDYQIMDMYHFRPDGTGDMSFSYKAMSNYWLLLPTEDPDSPNDYTKWTADELIGHHTGELLWGFKDNDLFYQTKRLKNNWKVDYIDLTFESDSIGGGARLDESRLGTDSPYAKVHWWVEPVSHLGYYVTWHIVGPKGCSYY